MKIMCKIWLKNGNIITEKIKVPKGKEQQAVNEFELIRKDIGDNKLSLIGCTVINSNEIVAIQAKTY